MEPNEQVRKHRRLLTKFIALSPFFALPSFSFEGPQLLGDDPLITQASQALNVFDFKRVAKAKLSRAHYGYLETGVLDDWTLLANEQAFQRIKLRIRRLQAVQGVDTTASVLGEDCSSPILLCPCGSQNAFHEEGEIATAKAAKTQNALQILSTMSTRSIEDVVAAKGSPVWYQLYPSVHWEDTLGMIDRAEKAGSRVIVLTVDSDHQDRRETYLRAARLDGGDCQSCHGQRNRANYVRNKPMVRELGQPFRLQTPLSWDYVKRLREATKLKLVLKGIVSGEDSRVALDYGVDGIMVSNHGGRVVESGRASLDSLAEVAAAVQGQIPVIMDGGVRRGKDVFKALAKGASLVGIGRPYLWGLSAFGQEGVEVVLKLLNAELKLAMQQTGVSSLAEISEAQLL